MTTIIGIDPGAEGGVAILRDGRPVFIMPIPMVGNEVHPGIFASMVNEHRTNVIAVVERQQPMPKNGSIACFRLGQNYGTLIGVLCTLAIRTELVSPKVWKEQILPNTKKDKPAAVAYCARSFPGVNLRRTAKCKTAHDGMADALCIAEYGHRMFLSTTTSPAG